MVDKLTELFELDTVEMVSHSSGGSSWWAAHRLSAAILSRRSISCCWSVEVFRLWCVAECVCSLIVDEEVSAAPLADCSDSSSLAS